jgi:hypothetical protein
MDEVSSTGAPGPGDQSRLSGHRYEWHGWPSPEPRRSHRRPAAPEPGPWSRLPSGFTIETWNGPVHPLCAHASQVRPGSEVWADDCAELAEYARPIAGFEDDLGAMEFACALHARHPYSPGALAWE